ncbi:MAG: hypothetical protein GKR88_21105 [Flavobacteriaceae bacterium]|nr:MAG: hypothetical protein GKR88_04025 [Flavobacteriaceae bacterium]QMU66214.1 MAG: hypothetical protein GKR88_19315 [Flavobacteriaceae bacterium]QMU66539.1 MAG: hypothetical protein GKR88_21105 [Flavobacteriaceae bacterium]
MNIETTKLELMQMLLQTQKESVLAKIKSIFEQESSTFYSTKISDLQQRAEESLKSIESGETRPIEEFKNQLDNWKNNQAI